MLLKLILLAVISNVMCYNVQTFENWQFKVGIEYENSLPMNGGSDRYRHRNNYDPFFVTVTASAKEAKGYVRAAILGALSSLTTPLRIQLEDMKICGNMSTTNGYVLSYLEVTATTDESGHVEFCVIRGQTGARSMVFQLVSNHSDFLAYSYTAYGIREEQYKKITNVITLPPHNHGTRIRTKFFTYSVIFFTYCLFRCM